MERRRKHIGFWWGSWKEIDHYEHQNVGGWIILRWILDRMGWYGFEWSG
jgi:hypothetical protein